MQSLMPKFFNSLGLSISLFPWRLDTKVFNTFSFCTCKSTMLMINMFIISSHDLWFQTKFSICMILQSYQGRLETEIQKRFGKVIYKGKSWGKEKEALPGKSITSLDDSQALLTYPFLGVAVIWRLHISKAFVEDKN